MLLKELDFEHESNHQDNSQSVESDCLSPEWCGLACNEFCDNCQEDINHAIECKMDEFYRGRN